MPAHSTTSKPFREEAAIKGQSTALGPQSSLAPSIGGHDSFYGTSSYSSPFLPSLNFDFEFPSIDEANRRVAEWTIATSSSAVLDSSASYVPPSRPSSYESPSLSSFSSPSSSEYHDSLEFFPHFLETSFTPGSDHVHLNFDFGWPSPSNNSAFEELPAPSTLIGHSPPISDVLAHGQEDIANFQQRWSGSFSSSKFIPGKDSVKEAFAIVADAQEVLLLQTAFLEVHLGQYVLEMQSMVQDLIHRKALLKNTFEANSSLQTWGLTQSPQVDMFCIARDYIIDHAAFSKSKSLIKQTDEFIVRHGPARGVGARFLRESPAVWKCVNQ